MVLGLIFLVEFYFLYHIFVKYKYSFISFSYFIFLFYAQACYLDYLIFDKTYFTLLVAPDLALSITDDNFLYTSFSYFLFLIGYVAFLLLDKRKYLFHEEINFVIRTKVHKVIINFLYLLFIIYLFIYLNKIIGLDRTMIKLTVGNIIDSLFFATITFFWLFLVLKTNKRNILFYIFSILLFVNFIIVFEREYLVIIALVIFYKYFSNVKLSSFFVMISLGILVMAYSKIIMVGIAFSKNYDDFFKFVSNNTFSFSKMEPLPSFLIISNYFKAGNIYENYPLTYLTHSVVHFIKTFFSFEFDTLAQQATKIYTNNEMGTAYSLVLESLINFQIIGPLIIGLVISYIYLKLYKNMINTYGDLLNILLIIVSLKLIRTEFSIVLKLYILPMIISYILFSFLFKKGKFYEK